MMHKKRRLWSTEFQQMRVPTHRMVMMMTKKTQRSKCEWWLPQQQAKTQQIGYVEYNGQTILSFNQARLALEIVHFISQLISACTGTHSHIRTLTHAHYNSNKILIYWRNSARNAYSLYRTDLCAAWRSVTAGYGRHNQNIYY